MNDRSPQAARTPFLLGAMIAVGPIGIDMYLPAFPAIAASFHCSIAVVQSSLIAYFAMLALGQLIYGPLSDRFGRRPTVAAGLALYILAAAGILVAPSAAWLIALRALQGLGGCGGTVVARSIVRDVAEGPAAAALLSKMLLVFGLAPILAPALGGVLMLRFSWHAIFVFMIAFAAAVLLAVRFALSETHHPDRRSTKLRRAFAAYGQLLRDPRYLLTTAAGGLMQGAFFAYLAGSPFAFVSLYHLTPLLYSCLFGVNAVALIGGSQINVRLMRRLGGRRLIVAAAAIATAVALLLWASAAVHRDGAAGTFAGLLVIIACQGIVAPTATVLALERYPHASGAAAAFLGMALYAVGTIAGEVVGAAFNGTILPMLYVILGCTSGALLLAYLLPPGLSRRERSERVQTP